VQTWLPFTVQIYVNGHDYLARQMAPKGLGFVQQDNAFVQLDDPAKAQKLADKFAELNWPKRLARYADVVNPLRSEIVPRQSYYWVADQAEYATDVLFTNRSALRELFPRLLEFAWLTFSPKNVLGFLGRKLHACFDGEVLTDVKTEREPGARIKHSVKRNWLKLYDKFGRILRVETVINQPGEFKIYRECHHQDGTRSWGWRPMPKGVGNLRHYQRPRRSPRQLGQSRRRIWRSWLDSGSHDATRGPVGGQRRSEQPGLGWQRPAGRALVSACATATAR
jgi:hypothetical protein